MSGAMPAGNARQRPLPPFLLSGLVAIGLLIAASLALGAVRIPLADIGPALFGSGNDEFTNRVIDQIRLPRVLCALLVGASLALAGALSPAALASGGIAANVGDGRPSGAAIGLAMASTTGEACNSSL